jgi:hypothetical protein
MIRPGSRGDAVVRKVLGMNTSHTRATMMRWTSATGSVCAGLLVLATGCAPSSQGSAATPDSGAAAAPESDQQAIARLEREARALAKTTGCSSASACRTAPVGAKGCGGPRTYLVYCAATTDTVKLFARLRALEQAEKAYNAKSGMMSTCEMRLPPRTALVGQSCRESGSAQPMAPAVPQ